MRCRQCRTCILAMRDLRGSFLNTVRAPANEQAGAVLKSAHSGAWGCQMHEYEIRILQASGSAIITCEIQLSDVAAIRSARKMARGRQFEVWKGLECITGLALVTKPAA